MKRPILFTTDLVRAILEGRKTQTRRRIKFNCDVGDELWVRETWRVETATDASPYGKGSLMVYIQFKDGVKNKIHFTPDRANKFRKYLLKPNEWIPSLFMPIEACRLFLRAEKVWEERLNDITNDDAKKEGVIPMKMGAMGSEYVKSFADLWRAMKPKIGEDWSDNPLVKVIEFSRVEK